MFIVLLLLISDDDVIVVGAVGDNGSKNNRERKMIGRENRNYCIRIICIERKKTIGERNIIRYVLHTKNNSFSMGKRNMGNKRFLGFVPNHQKWGEC